MGGYIGATAVGLTTTAADVQGDITSTDTTPELILKNTSEEDTEGGREGKITFKGEQSGGEESTLAQIESAHDGTSDDQKGDLIFKTNDGSDGASPTEAMRITSQQRLGIGTNDPTELLTVRGAAHFGKAAIETSADTPVIIKSDTDHLALHLEENSGAESWQIGVDADGDLGFHNSGAAGASVTFDDSGNVGIGTSSPSKELHVVGASTPEIRLQNSDNNYALDLKVNATVAEVKASAELAFLPAGSEAARFQSSGRLLIGKTSGSRTSAGCELNQSGFTRFTAASDKSLELVRTGSDGEVIEFFNDSTLTGSMGVNGDRTYLAVPGHGIALDASGNSVLPSTDTGGNQDNVVDIGASSARYDDVFATNGTIQTSDEREKQQIASLTDAEMTAAKAISKLFKTFKWNDSVTEKGDNARTHAGVIAQQVETAMSDAGLNAGNYAFFISDTWWETQTEVAAVEADEENGIEAKDAYTEVMSYPTQEAAPEGATERNRKGIRYPELLSFIGAATEQRLTSIEARLDALEG